MQLARIMFVGFVGVLCLVGARASVASLPGMGGRVSVIAPSEVYVVTSGGDAWWVYELVITNNDPRSFSFHSVDVLSNQDVDVPLRSFHQPELSDALSAPWIDDGVLKPGVQAMLVFAYKAPAAANVSSINHRISLKDSNSEDTVSVTTAELSFSDVSVPILQPPLAGGNWYAHSALTVDAHHRRMIAPRDGTLTFDQRFAVDLFRVSQSEEGATYLPDWEKTRGQTVRSVGPGVVVNVVDGLPDSEFGVRSMLDPEITWDTIGGNLVVVQLDTGGFAWYEHLRNGTIKVRKNDRVDAGTPMAKIGASGNTGGAPHLHFELTNSPEKGLGDGLPYVFSCYRLSKAASERPDWDSLVLAPEIVVRAPENEQSHRVMASSFPIGGSILSFSRGTSGRDACDDPDGSF